MFKYQGLKKFLGIETKVYHALVKLFYTNLHHPFDKDISSLDMDTLASNVSSTNFKFDEGNLADIFEIDYHDD